MVRNGGTFLKNRRNTYFWILFRVKLVILARYSDINAVLGVNIISLWIKLVFSPYLYLRDGGTFKKNHGGTVSSNKTIIFFIAIFLFLQRSILHNNNNIFLIIPSANMKNMTLQWWDIYICPMLFLTKDFFWFF